MQKKGMIYFILIFVFFSVLFFCNLLGLTPFGIALTSHIIMIFLLSFSIIFFVFLIGLMVLGVDFLVLFVPEAPLLLLFLLVPIELFSYAIRALSLAIRLSANIIAGHTLVFIVSNFILLLFTLDFFLVFLFFFFVFFFLLLLLLIFLLETGVAFLQAYVFIILFSIYMHDSLYKV